MNILRLSWANFLDKPLQAILNLSLVMLGSGLILFVLNAKHQTEIELSRKAEGIDMVVGAKGSPLQIILSSVFHIDDPTGNISYREAMKLKNNPLIDKVIPLSLGDNYNGFRIVGTDSSFISGYDLQFSKGELWKEPMACVLGSDVAKETGLKPGNTFLSSHGLDESGTDQHHHPLFVSGILKPSGKIADKLILTSFHTIWDVHHQESTSPNSEQEITSLLVKFKSKMGFMTLPRMINSSTSMQAALPSFEINRLYELFGTGSKMLFIIAAVIVMVSAFSIFISLLNALKERLPELALLRTGGATPAQIFLLVVFEGFWIVFLGLLSGILLSRGLLAYFSWFAGEQLYFNVNELVLIPEEILVIIGILVLSLLAAAIPAVRARRVQISNVLAEK